MTIEQQTMKLLTEAWPGAPYRLRINKLAGALACPVDDVRDALDRLIAAGEIAIYKGERGAHVKRCHRGPFLRLRHPPAVPKPTRWSSDFALRHQP